MSEALPSYINYSNNAIFGHCNITSLRWLTPSYCTGNKISEPFFIAVFLIKLFTGTNVVFHYILFCELNYTMTAFRCTAQGKGWCNRNVNKLFHQLCQLECNHCLPLLTSLVDWWPRYIRARSVCVTYRHPSNAFAPSWSI